MLIVNGTIAAMMKTGGGIDPETGNPVKPSKSWGDPVPCHISTVRHNNLGRQNGNTFIAASYEVLIEPRPFEAERVKLTRFGRDSGEFSVISFEYLDAVGAIKITV